MDLFVAPFEEQLFEKYFRKLYQRLAAFESNKHLPPKYSYAVKDLATHFGVFADPGLPMSGSSSNASFSSFFQASSALVPPYFFCDKCACP